MAIMTERRKRFIVEYLVDLNATQAAIRAGYSPKTARSTGYELLNIPEIRNEIDERLKTIEESRICDVQEVMEFLTSVMRGEITEEVLVVLRVGGGKTEARLIPKGPSLRAHSLPSTVWEADRQNAEGLSEKLTEGIG